MKKLLKYLSVIVFMLIFIVRPKALCTDNNYDVSKIEFYYEVKDLSTFSVDFLSTTLPDGLRIVVKDKNGKAIIDSKSEDLENNFVYFAFFDMEELKEGFSYTFEAYSSTCQDEPLYTQKLEEKSANVYYSSNSCFEHNYLDACQPFTNNNGLTEEEFEKKIDIQEKEYQKEQKKKEKSEKKKDQINDVRNSVLDTIKTDYMYFVVPFVVVVLVVIVLVVLKKKKVTKDEED